MIKELADQMVGNLGLSLGTTLQVGFRPETAPDTCTAILERTPALVDSDLPNYKQKPFQVLTRGQGYHATRQEAERIAAYLLGLRGVQFPTFYLAGVKGTSPGWIGIDAKQRHEFSCNVTFYVRMES